MTVECWKPVTIVDKQEYGSSLLEVCKFTSEKIIYLSPYFTLLTSPQSSDWKSGWEVIWGLPVSAHPPPPGSQTDEIQSKLRWQITMLHNFNKRGRNFRSFHKSGQNCTYLSLNKKWGACISHLQLLPIYSSQKRVVSNVGHGLFSFLQIFAQELSGKKENRQTWDDSNGTKILRDLFILNTPHSTWQWQFTSY